MPFESKKLIGCLWNCHTSFCLSGTPCNFWTGSLKINNYNKNIGKPLNIILCVKSAIMQTRFRKVKSLYSQCDFWFMFSHCKSRVLYVNFMRNSNNLEWSPQVFLAFYGYLPRISNRIYFQSISLSSEVSVDGKNSVRMHAWSWTFLNSSLLFLVYTFCFQALNLL